MVRRIYRVAQKVGTVVHFATDTCPTRTKHIITAYVIIFAAAYTNTITVRTVKIAKTNKVVQYLRSCA